MIVGTGIDLVNVGRMAHWLEDMELCRKYFQEEELQDVLAKGCDASRSLAAHFAAKEAFIKALGSGFANLALKDICVKNEPSGRPVMQVEGNILVAMQSVGACRIHLSLTHEQNMAAAQVILED